MSKFDRIERIPPRRDPTPCPTCAEKDVTIKAMSERTERHCSMLVSRDGRIELLADELRKAEARATTLAAALGEMDVRLTGVEAERDHAKARATAAEQERDRWKAGTEFWCGQSDRMREEAEVARTKLAAAEAHVTALAQREAEKDKAVQTLIDGLSEHIQKELRPGNLPRRRARGAAMASTSVKPCDWCGEHPPYVQGVPMCPACGGYAIEAVRVRPSTPSPDACAPGAEGEPIARCHHPVFLLHWVCPVCGERQAAQPPQRPGAQPEAAAPRWPDEVHAHLNKLYDQPRCPGHGLTSCGECAPWGKNIDDGGSSSGVSSAACPCCQTYWPSSGPFSSNGPSSSGARP